MMKPLVATALSAVALVAAAQEAKYAIDPTHTFVIYEIDHYDTTINRGRFGAKGGSVRIDRAARRGWVDITIDIGSISTGVDVLNRHVQSKDFFNAADFPTGRFVSERFAFDGDKVSRVDGTLTLLGRSHPVSLKANRFNCYASPMLKRQVCGGDFETTIQRSRWGITWGLGFGFEDTVRLLIQVEGVHQP